MFEDSNINGPEKVYVRGSIHTLFSGGTRRHSGQMGFAPGAPVIRRVSASSVVCRRLSSSRESQPRMNPAQKRAAGGCSPGGYLWPDRDVTVHFSRGLNITETPQRKLLSFSMILIMRRLYLYVSEVVRRVTNVTQGWGEDCDNGGAEHISVRPGSFTGAGHRGGLSLPGYSRAGCRATGA